MQTGQCSGWVCLGSHVYVEPPFLLLCAIHVETMDIVDSFSSDLRTVRTRCVKTPDFHFVVKLEHVIYCLDTDREFR